LRISALENLVIRVIPDTGAPPPGPKLTVESELE